MAEMSQWKKTGYK